MATRGNAVPLVQMRGMSKRFPGVVANDRIDLTVHAGEVHALLGENGAGKTTLMKLLYGVYRPDAGEIAIDGKPVEIRNPQQALQLGIGMVFQHFTLIPTLTVAENIVLGLSSPRFYLSPEALTTRIEAVASRYGLSVQPQARVWQLSVGEQQRVELLKLLYRGARILILDEPTAVLTPPETRLLFRTLRNMARQGYAIIFITHKLDEVMTLADRITVLRQGRVMATLQRQEATRGDLVRLMVGREMLPRPQRLPLEPGEEILTVKELSARDDRGVPALRRVSLTVRRREILGVAGVAGNGQRELGEVLAGLRPATGGQVLVQGRDVTNASPAEVIRQGVSLIPEDRLEMGLVAEASLLDNLLLKSYRTPAMRRGPFLDYQAARQEAQQLLATLQIDAPHLNLPVRVLSGGNLQRLLLGRELSTRPVLLLAFHPTRGLDVAATEAVHRLLLQQREQGAAMLLISEDLEEIMTLSDRIAVMYRGEVVGLLRPEETSGEELGFLMTGGRIPQHSPTSEG